MSLAQRFATIDERRASERFPIRIPITLLSEGRNISAFTGNISAQGIFFYFPIAESAFINQDHQELDFIIEFPSELTLCASMRVRCFGKAVRKQNTAQYETGVGAKICRYIFLPAVEEP
jgi:hypothetical protein